MSGEKKVGVYCAETLERVAVFNSVTKCAKKYDAAFSSITRAARSGVKFRKKYYLRFKGDTNSDRSSDFPMKMKLSLEVTENQRNAGKQVILKPFYNFNEEFKFKSLVGIAEFLSITSKAVLQLIRSEKMIKIDGEKYKVRLVNPHEINRQMQVRSSTKLKTVLF